MMPSWDELEKKYGGSAPAASGGDAWSELEQKYSAPPAVPPAEVKQIDALPKRDVSAMDRVNAGLAGVNHGFFADLAGLPVDTAANVLDLVKAGIGASYQAFTGKPAESMQPYDRKNIPLTSEWIASKADSVGLGSAINNQTPDDAASRILFAGGRGAGASIVPVRSLPISGTRNALNMAGGAASGVAAGTAAEVSDDPSVAAIAGMLPALAKQGGAAALRSAVRGGDAGARNMQQRIQDFKNGGVDAPSVGLASGNGFIQGVENLLAQTPGSTGVFQRSKDAMIDGMQNRAGQIRDSVSPVYGPLEAGAAVQKDIGGSFRDHFKASQEKLYGKVDAQIPGATKVPVKNTASALETLTAGIDGAPHIGDRFINGKISSINDALRLDTGLAQKQGSRTASNTAPATPVESLPRVGGANVPVPGRPAITVTRTVNPYASVAGEGAWKPSALPQLPYKAVSKLRTQVGKELDGNMLLSDVPRSQWKQLYGSLSQDIGGAAAASGPKATQAWQRANDYTKKGIARLEDLQKISDQKTPEGAYGSLSGSLKAGPTSYERARNAVTTGTRQKFVATVVDELGMATPGQQGADGTGWSPRTFLTNYNKLDPKGRAALFTRLPGGKAHAENLADIAKTAEMIGQGSKVWANPSGTSAALSARATLGGIGVGALYSPMLAAGTATSLVGAHGASRLLTNPIFVNWLAKAPRQNPQTLQAYAQRLAVNAKLTKDAQFQQDVDDYLGSLSDQSNDSIDGDAER